MKIDVALDALATHTFEFLVQCQLQEIAVTEDVITTNNLLFLKRHVPKTSVIWDTRNWEKAIGCDFEMWVGSDSQGWRGYAIQAKRIDLASGNYLALGHSNAFGAQIDLLESYARSADLEPIYLFYNAFIPLRSGLCASSYTVEQQGCTITPSRLVRLALSTRGARNFRWLHGKKPTTLWRCLVCSSTARCSHSHSAVSKAPPKALPWHVRSFLEGDPMPTARFADYERQLRSKAIVVVDTSEDER